MSLSWCQCIPSQGANVFQLGAWLCKHETALPHTIHFETIRPQFPLWHSQNQYTCNVTVPDVSVFHHKEPLCFNWVLDYVSMRLLSPHTIHLEPSVLQFSSSALTEQIHVVNVTVPDVSVFHHKESIVVFNWGLDLCKHETALPHTIHLETIPSSSCAALALTEQYTSNVTVLMSVYSITRSQLCSIGCLIM